MYKNIEPFGFHVYGETLGDAWLDLVAAILHHGDESLDEGRKRISLQNVRIKTKSQVTPDKLITKYGDKKNIKALLDLTFNHDEMYDFDVVQSFPPGAASYYKRIKDGNMLHFVVERLGRYPESKKAVIVFPNNKDYKAVLEAPTADYLPCIVSIQFRLLEVGNGFIMNTIFNARSIDAFQKANGNFVAMGMLSNIVAKRLTKKLGKPVEVGPLDGMVTDAHIYGECLEDAKELIKNAKDN